jgi:hypothetical protein
VRGARFSRRGPDESVPSGEATEPEVVAARAGVRCADGGTRPSVGASVRSSESSLQNGGHEAEAARLLIAQMTASWHDMEVVIGFSGPALASPRLSKLALLAAVGIWAGAFVACSGGEAPPYVPPKGSGGAGGESGLGGAAGAGPRPQCRENAQKECTVYVELANGITSCWYGTKYCVDGRWSECLEDGADPRTQGAR